MGKLTQEELKELLHYDPDTGVFTWKKGRQGRIKKGGIAGNEDQSGYCKIVVKGKRYGAHRLAFLYMEGYFPEHQVDHINRDRGDNRWVNLREATHTCNMRNCSRSKNKKHDLPKGVFFRINEKTPYFISGIGIKGLRRECKVGGHSYHSSLGEACALRFALEQCLGFPECDRSSEAGQWMREIISGVREDCSSKEFYERK